MPEAVDRSRVSRRSLTTPMGPDEVAGAHDEQAAKPAVGPRRAISSLDTVSGGAAAGGCGCGGSPCGSGWFIGTWSPLTDACATESSFSSWLQRSRSHRTSSSSDAFRSMSDRKASWASVFGVDATSWRMRECTNRAATRMAREAALPGMPAMNVPVPPHAQASNKSQSERVNAEKAKTPFLLGSGMSQRPSCGERCWMEAGCAPLRRARKRSPDLSRARRPSEPQLGKSRRKKRSLAASRLDTCDRKRTMR